MSDDNLIGYPITKKDSIITDTPNFRIAVGPSGWDENPCIKLAFKDAEGNDYMVHEFHQQEAVMLVKGFLDAFLEYP